MMPFDPDRHHRRSPRLQGYDYSRPGAYFVTVCVHGRMCLLGDVAGGEVCLSEAGKMVLQTWRELPEHYPGVSIDAAVVMPNHFHGIVILRVVERPATAAAPWRDAAVEIPNHSSLPPRSERIGLARVRGKAVAPHLP